MSQEDVSTEIVDATLVVTLDRPKANAIDAATSRELSRVFADFRDDDRLRAAVFTGAGQRFFSAGWDLGAAAAGEEYEADYGEGGFGGFAELPGLRKPVIAAVNGLAVGGGFELVLSADLAVGAEHAEFFLPEAGLGIIADSGAIRLPRMLPAAVANEVLYAQRRLDAAEAERWGLLNAVVSADELLGAALALAERVAEAAPLAVEATIDIGRRTAGMTLGDAYRELRSGDVEPYERMLASEDAAEGPAAFAEKRSPVWKAR